MDGWTVMIVQDRTTRWPRTLTTARTNARTRALAMGVAGRRGVHTCCVQGSAGIMTASERVAVVGSQ